MRALRFSWVSLLFLVLAGLLSVTAGCDCSGDDGPGPREDAGDSDAGGDGGGVEGDGGADGGLPDTGGFDSGPARCGDEIVQAGEACDDGNTMDGDGCRADCSSDERCGNGIVDMHIGETCDDGNTINGDGCSADCTSDETCGNGIVDLGVGEVCDDGNTTDGDGCSADCMTGPTCGDGTVTSPEVCDDGNTMDGDGCSGDCTRLEACGNLVTDPGEECDDGNTTGGDGCSAACRLEVCGNGVVDPGEACDDGNGADGDGCDADCTFTCATDAECDDAAPCNGAEVCDPGTHLCGPGAPAADGTACGSGLVCRTGACVMVVCGDGRAEGGEICDDGNSTDGDGCDNDCTYSCTAAAECDDAAPCNGAEGCNATTHACVPGIPAADGTGCGSGLVCRGGACVTTVCGDGRTEGAEACDDGNSVDGDGCDGDCTFSCVADADCDDGNVCTGAETCNTTTHVCRNPADLADGTDCGMGRVCRAATCVTPVCGDGRVEGTEACDDMNSVEGDGCDNDCTFSCTVTADCDDGNPCTGAETCTLATHTCTNPPDLADGTSCGAGRVCRGGTCAATMCGNGLPEPGEQCDDGNTVDGDGCDNDCTFSCSADADCTDGDVCNGAETCNTTTHVCRTGTAPAPGTLCDRDMDPMTRDVCLGGVCAASICGDRFVDAGRGEQCDDGNTTMGDGCDNDCTFSCEADADCTDGLVCNGGETCNTTTHVCRTGTAPADGTACDRDMMPGTRDICRMGSCVASVCGDGYVDAGGSEQCEDGNTVNGDGCDNDCTFSCTVAADCTDGLVCNGSETCNTTTHVCVPGTPAMDGTVCDRDMMPGTRDICRMGTCVATRCGDGYVDTGGGEQCEDGNAVNGDGCDNDCTFSCTADADCNDGLVCNGAETCNTTTHVCRAGMAAADGTVCDRDMMAGTRDICRMAVCVASTCGDGFLDTGNGEMCDDGNLVAGDGCEPDCRPTGPRPTAFRIVTMRMRDPHFFIDFFGCRDVTDTPLLGFSVNGELQSNLDDYSLNYALVFRPLAIMMMRTPLDVVEAACMAGPPVSCGVDPMGTVTPTDANNQGVGTECYRAPASTLTAMYTPEVNVVTGPCFVSDPEMMVVTVGGIDIPLRDARVAATYTGGPPPDRLVSGVISGFISEADARATILPASLPLVGGDTLYEHLAAGRSPGSSCAAHDDRDTYMGTRGFWMYFDFTANVVTWTGP